PNPFSARGSVADCRVKPDNDEVRGGRASKILIPAFSLSPILPLTTPLLRTQAQRTFGRDRFGFLMGRHGEGPKRTDGRMWIKGGATLPRRTRETRRGSERTARRSQQSPARERRHKPKIPSAWGDGRFIYINLSAERSSPHAVHQQTPGLTAAGGLAVR